MSYFSKKKIPCVTLPSFPSPGKICILISENGGHAGFFDGTSLWNPNDAPNDEDEGLNNGDGFDHLEIPRGFTQCPGPGASHNMQGLALDSQGHIIPPHMIGRKEDGKIEDEGGLCFLLALGYYQYAFKDKKNLCEIINESHLVVLELAKKIYKRDMTW